MNKNTVMAGVAAALYAGLLLTLQKLFAGILVSDGWLALAAVGFTLGLVGIGGYAVRSWKAEATEKASLLAKNNAIYLDCQRASPPKVAPGSGHLQVFMVTMWPDDGVLKGGLGIMGIPRGDHPVHWPVVGSPMVWRCVATNYSDEVFVDIQIGVQLNAQEAVKTDTGQKSGETVFVRNEIIRIERLEPQREHSVEFYLENGSEMYVHFLFTHATAIPLGSNERRPVTLSHSTARFGGPYLGPNRLDRQDDPAANMIA